MTFFKFPKFGQRPSKVRKQSAFRRMMRVEDLESRKLLVSDVSITPLSAVKFEGITGTTAYTFQVSRVNDLTSTATVAYSRGPDVPGNGIDINDFSGSTANITFSPNQASQVLTVLVNGDRDVEADEVFRITLVQIFGGNANVVGAPATGTIQNDDTDWVLSLPTPNLAEGSVGASTAFPALITRVGYLGAAMNINYATAPTGASPAATTDILGGVFPSGTVSFAIGEAAKTVTVNVVADRVIEPNETYSVSISGAPATTDINVGGPLTQTILNDDIDITLSPTTNSVTEGHTVNPTLVYTLTRTGNGIAQVVNFAVTGTGANPATAADFPGGVFPTGSVSFTAVETVKTFTIAMLADRDVELDETFKVTVSTTDVNTDFINDNTVSTIINDDEDFTVVALDATKVEGTTGSTTPYTFTVSRTGLLDAISIDYAVTGSGGAPADASDFVGAVLPAATLSFAANEVSKVVTINVRPDRDVESDEGFSVTLTASGNADVVGAPATGSITNDDTDFALSLTPSSQAEGSDATFVTYDYTVTRTGLLDAMSINYAVSGIGGNQATPDDFVGGVMPSGTLSFASGEVSKTVSVQIVSDRDVELNETFRLLLSGAPTTTDIVAPTSLTSTITNDDIDYTISSVVAATAEGQTGAFQLTYAFSRTGALVPADFTWAVVGSGANPADAADFQGGVFPSGTMNFANGSASRQIIFRVQGDRDVEMTEGYDLVITPVVPNPNADYVGGLTWTDTIVNDDVDMGIVATDAVKDEGHTGTTNYTFTVTRSGLLDVRTSDWAVTGSGANPADATDFVGGVLPSGQINWLSGETTRVLTIAVQADEAPEMDEGFTLTLSNVGADVDLSPASADGTIVNDEAVLTITPIDVVKAEANSGTVPFTFLITRTGNPARALTGTWSGAGSGANPATVTTDFTASGSFSLAANQLSRVLTVTGRGDRVVEADEGFTVTIALSPASAAFASISDATEDAVLENDDIDLSITGALSQNEGTASTIPYTFTVTRAGDPDQAFTVDYAVTGNTATAATPDDFSTPMTGTVSFASGEMSKDIVLQVVNDRDVEGNEGFKVTLSNPSPATNIDLAVASKTATITNDDADYVLTATNANKNELNTGASNWTFTLARTGIRPAVSGIGFSVVGSGVNAADATDFNGGVLPSGTINLAANAGSGVINVSVKGDTTVEYNETFTVSVNIPADYDLVTGSAIGTIKNDENAYGITAIAANTVEGGAGHVFEITRFGTLTAVGSVKYSVLGTGADPADASDFGGAFPTAVTVNFPIGIATQLITIASSADAAVEADEGFIVTLSAPTPVANQLSPSFANGLVLNDDTEVSITAVSGSQGEGASGTTNFPFTITRTGGTGAALVLNFSTAGTGANPASAADFVGGVLPSGTVTIPVGQSSVVLNIPVAGDQVTEADEDFEVTLTGPGGVTFLNDTALMSILNDETTVDFAVDGTANLNEGNASTTSFNFTLTRSGLTTGTTVVNYSVAGSGANPASASDFNGGVFASGTVTFAPGELTKSLSIHVNGDISIENNEQFTVTLTAGANDILPTPSLDRVILNDDVEQLSITALGGGSSLEGNSSQTAYVFQVSRPDSTFAYTFNYSAVGAGANPASAGDFSGATSGSVTFNPGESTKNITILVNGDRDVESDETFDVTISGGTANYVVPTASATILTEDLDVALTASSLTGFEGTMSGSLFSFTVTRTGDASQAFTADYAIAGTGANPINASDFGSALVGTVSFGVGEMSKVITLSVMNDRDVELDETFSLTLSNLSTTNADLGTASAAGQLTNDDADFSIVPLASATATEGNTTKNFSFTLSRVGYAPALSTIAYVITGTGANPTNSADFRNGLVSGNQTLTLGQLSKTISFVIQGDTTVEANETFLVNINPGAEYDVIVNDALGTILNDD